MAFLRVVQHGTGPFETALAALVRRGSSDLSRIETQVQTILDAVRAGGDSAVRDFIRRFEQRDVDTLLLRDYQGREALESLPTELQTALRESAARIARYHEHQKPALAGFEYTEEGVTLASRVRPLERVGLYAPGGKARYPSTVLMTAIPAKVAGVDRVVLACPSTGPEVRAACHLAGVDAILDAGGAHAIAALAFGTETVPRVDKIVGPGNLYVTAAKRLVFGQVDIDSLAGPSEILVVADDSASASYVAADLLSQAEHDEDSYAMLLTSSRALVEAVETELERQLATQPRHAIARASLAQHGIALLVPTALLPRVASDLAAEHVALHTRDAATLAGHIRHAGAIFVGANTPEAAGDYFAGPSHVLPTGGSARFGSPLGVYDFVSRTSIIDYDRAALLRQGPNIATLARAEGLEAHARAVEVRGVNSPKPH